MILYQLMTALKGITRKYKGKYKSERDGKTLQEVMDFMM